LTLLDAINQARRGLDLAGLITRLGLGDADADADAATRGP